MPAKPHAPQALSLLTDALTAAQREATAHRLIADAAAARVADLATAIRILQGPDDAAPIAFSPKSAPGAWPTHPLMELAKERAALGDGPNPSPGFVIDDDDHARYADDGNPHHDEDKTCDCKDACAAGLDFATCWNRPATVAAFVANLVAITDDMQRTADAAHADTQWALARIAADRRRAQMVPGPDGRGCPDHPDGECFKRGLTARA